jgi:hypothetical protein
VFSGSEPRSHYPPKPLASKRVNVLTHQTLETSKASKPISGGGGMVSAPSTPHTASDSSKPAARGPATAPGPPPPNRCRPPLSKLRSPPLPRPPCSGRLRRPALGPQVDTVDPPVDTVDPPVGTPDPPVDTVDPSTVAGRGAQRAPTRRPLCAISRLGVEPLGPKGAHDAPTMRTLCAHCSHKPFWS